MFDNEVQLLQKEKEEVTKLKNEYSKLKQQLHKDIEEFNKYLTAEISIVDSAYFTAL